MRIVLAFVWLTIVSFIEISPVVGQSDQEVKQTIDSLMRSYYLPQNPGASIQVVKDHELFFESSYGLSNLDEGIENKPETIFKIGSMTKQFTAICILKLVEEEKLALNDVVTSFYPEWFNDHALITIRQLLSHQSGVQDLPKFKKIRELIMVESTPDELIEIISGAPLEFVPGDEYAYSNSNYVILGGILEQVTGKTYGSVLNEHIFKPLGMENTYFAPLSEIPDNHASGYFSRPETFAPAPEVSHSLMYAAGGLWSTIGDMAKWNEALYTNRIINRELIELAFAPQSLNGGVLTDYGFGFRSCAINGMPSIEHGGGVFGYNSYGIRIESEGAYVIILSNFEGGNKYADLAAQIAAITINKPYRTSTATLKSRKLKRLTGSYINDDGDTLTIANINDTLWLQRSNKKDKMLQYLDKYRFRLQGTVDNQILFDPKNDALDWKPRRSMDYKAVRLEND